MRISDWSSDVCSSDLRPAPPSRPRPELRDHLVARVEERAGGIDHALVPGQPADDGDALVRYAAGLYVPANHLVLGIDDIDEIALLVALDRGFRQQRRLDLAAADLCRGKAARPQRLVVAERDADRALARLRIDDRRNLPDLARKARGRSDRRHRRRLPYPEPGEVAFGQRRQHLHLAALGEPEQRAAGSRDNLAGFHHPTSEEHTTELPSLMRI